MSSIQSREVSYQPVYTWAGPPRLEVQRAAVDRPHGQQYMSHRLVVQEGRPGAVIFAHRDGSVALVKSYRPAAGADFWELPRGFGEAEDAAKSGKGNDLSDEEAMVQAGLRELGEETGLSAIQWRLLGVYVLDPSIYPTKVGVVWADVGGGEPADTDGEIESLVWVRLTEFPGLVASGALRDAHSLAALAILWGSQQGGAHIPD